MTAAPVDEDLVTLAWAERTGGSLDRAQKLQLRRATVALYGGLIVDTLTAPIRRPPARALPTPPDSALARTAAEAAADQGADLLGHGQRSFVFGATLAAQDHADVDLELLYVAALLHDLGLMSAVTGEDFTIRSAHAVLALDVDDPEWSDGRGRAAADAIVAHATPGVDRDRHRLGYYVQAGALADLGGMRAAALPRGHRRAAYRAYPDAGIHRSICTHIRDEAGAVPDGRFALAASLGFALAPPITTSAIAARLARR